MEVFSKIQESVNELFKGDVNYIGSGVNGDEDCLVILFNDINKKYQGISVHTYIEKYLRENAIILDEYGLGFCFGEGDTLLVQEPPTRMKN